jgi:hypothetical protein
MERLYTSANAEKVASHHHQKAPKSENRTSHNITDFEPEAFKKTTLDQLLMNFEIKHELDEMSKQFNLFDLTLGH